MLPFPCYLSVENKVEEKGFSEIEIVRVDGVFQVFYPL